MMNKSKIFVLSTIFLCILQTLIILISWIISAIFPMNGYNSLLSDSGLRWLLSHYINDEYTNYFLWFLFCSSFIGTFVWSKLPGKILSYKNCNYNDKFAIKVFLGELAIGLTLCIILAIFPHSSLLGITGRLFPGPFLRALIFLMGITIFCASISFLAISGKLKTYRDAENALVFGIQRVAPLIVMFFLLKGTLEMIRFVF